MSEFSETMFFIHALQNVQVQYTKKNTQNIYKAAFKYCLSTEAKLWFAEGRNVWSVWIFFGVNWTELWVKSYLFMF